MRPILALMTAGVQLWLAIPLASAQTTQEADVEMSLRLAKGQRFRLEYSKGREDFKPGQAEPTGGKAVSDIDLEVISTEANGLVIGWTMCETRLYAADGKTIEDRQAGGLVDLFTDITMKIKLSADLEEAEFVNYDEIKFLMAKAFDKVFDMKAGGDQSRKEQFRKTVGQVLESREVLEQLMLQDVMLLFEFSEASLAKGTREFEDEIAALGVMMPVKGQIKVTTSSEGDAVIEISQSIDPAKLPQVIERLFGGAGAAPTTKPSAEEMKKLRIDDQIKFVMDTRSGLPRSVWCKRTVSAPEGRKRVDTREIVVKPMPPATQPAS